MIAEAINLTSSMLTGFERLYTNDFLSIWDYCDFGMEDNLNLDEDDILDRLTDAISDKNIGIDAGQWSNDFKDGFIEAISTTHDGQLPHSILLKVSKSFKRITESIFKHILDVIEEDSDEDFEGKWDTDYLELVVGNWLMDDNSGLMYDGEYAQEIVSILMNPKLIKAEIKKFAIRMIKSGNLKAASIIKNIDKATYKKYENLFKLHGDFGFFDESANESVKVINSGKDVIIYKVNNIADVESLIEESPCTILSFNNVYIIDFIKEGMKVLALTTDEQYSEESLEDLPYFHYSFMKTGNKESGIIVYYNTDDVFTPMRDTEINKLIKKYKLAPILNKLFKGYAKENLTIKDIKHIKLEYLLYIYAANNDRGIGNVGGPNREGEDTLQFYADGPLSYEISKFVKNNMAVFSMHEIEYFTKLSSLNDLITACADTNYAYIFTIGDFDWFVISKYRIPSSYKYIVNDNFGQEYSRKGIHGYGDMLGDEIEVNSIELLIKAIEVSQIEEFDDVNIAEPRVLSKTIVTLFKRGNFKFANILKQIDIDAYNKYKYLISGNDQFDFFGDD